MGEELIFVSCGQLTPEEKTLGILLKTAIDGTPGFRAYCAQAVHDLEGLTTNVFDALRRCAGAVILLHERGIVTSAAEQPLGHRSSAWINQEIAILAYRQHVEAKPIPILAFADTRVTLDGAMTNLIVNPRQLGDSHTIVAQVKGWLSEGHFTSASDDVFQEKWNQLPEGARMAVAKLVDYGGYHVKLAVIRHAMVRSFDLAPEAAQSALDEAKGWLVHTDLVKLVHNVHSGDELSVHPTWELHLRREVANWRRDRKGA
jgi:hypothetical protein